eukprot:2934297-Rhodomonas_salina.1
MPRACRRLAGDAVPRKRGRRLAAKPAKRGAKREAGPGQGEGAGRKTVAQPASGAGRSKLDAERAWAGLIPDGKTRVAAQHSRDGNEGLGRVRACRGSIWRGAVSLELRVATTERVVGGAEKAAMQTAVGSGYRIPSTVLSPRQPMSGTEPCNAASRRSGMRTEARRF